MTVSPGYQRPAGVNHTPIWRAFTHILPITNPSSLAHQSMATSVTTSPVLPRLPEPSRAWGVAGVAATKGLDGITTMVGLAAAPWIVERNAFVASVMDAIGVAPALLLVGLATIVTIVLATEAAVVLSSRSTSGEMPRPGVIRLVGYGLPSLLHVAIATYNVSVITPALA